MNSLVVYDSQFGNTEKIARKIQETLAEYGVARALRVTDFTPDALAGVELLVLGCPTQAWHSTKAMQALVKGLPDRSLDNLCLAEFDTRLDKPRWLTGSAARALESQLGGAGIELVPPESFLVKGKEGPLEEGELEHAATWAHALYDEFQMQVGPVVVPM